MLNIVSGFIVLTSAFLPQRGKESELKIVHEKSRPDSKEGFGDLGARKHLLAEATIQQAKERIRLAKSPEFFLYHSQMMPEAPPAPPETPPTTDPPPTEDPPPIAPPPGPPPAEPVPDKRPCRIPKPGECP